MADRKVVQGTLELLILRTLVFGPLHGHGIARHIQRTSEDVLQVEHGSLLSSPGPSGEKQVYHRWDAVVRAIARVLKPV